MAVTKVMSKYNDPSAGRKMDTRPIVAEIHKRKILKQQQQRQQIMEANKFNPVQEPEESQLGFGSDQYGV
jgi:hypothetical protein